MARSSINLFRASAVIIIIALLANIFQDELRNLKFRVQEEIEIRKIIKRNKGNDIDEDRYSQLNERKYFTEADKCRDSQDNSKDEYFDQSYRECMENKGYDPYSFYK